MVNGALNEIEKTEDSTDRKAMASALVGSLRLAELEAKGFGMSKPRNPLHFGTIEGGRNSVSGGRTTRDTHSLQNTQ